MDPPVFSHPGGYFAPPLSLELACPTPGAEIRFTADATDPGEASTLYAAPIRVIRPLCIRARAFAPGRAPSPVRFATFLPGIQPPLPLLCLVTDPRHLHDPNTGLHTQVGGRGEEWERPASVAFYEPGGKIGFSLDAGLRLAGGVSRNFRKHSYRVYFREKYGAGCLEYPLFGDRGIRRHHCLRVRASGNDQVTAEGRWTLMRDALNNVLYAEAGGCATDVRFALVSLNADFLGVYDLREHCNGDFLREKYGIQDPDLAKVSIYLGGPWAAKDGDLEAWKALQSFFRANDFAEPEAFRRLGELVDLDDWIVEHAVRFYGNDWDWPQNNRYMFRDRKDGGRWRFVIWDSEWTFDLNGSCGPAANILAAYLDDLNPGRRVHTFMFIKALQNREFRLRFANRCADLLNTVFLPARVIAHIDRMAAEIEPAIPLEARRWGGSLEQWKANVEVLRAFARDRPAHFRGQLSGRFGEAGGLYPLRVERPGAPGGTVKVNTLALRPDELPWTGTYFSGLPVRVRAVPGPGYRFAGWAPPFGGQGPEIEADGTRGGAELVRPGSDWSFFAGAREPDPEWKDPGYPAWFWLRGEAPLGYGEGDEKTPLPFGEDPGAKWPSAYFRRSFVAEGGAEDAEVELGLVFDDGLVLYLNGSEALRVNMPGGAVQHGTWAAGTVGGEEERAWRRFTIPGRLLRPGRNLLAAEVHQGNGTSSDLRFDLSMRLVRPVTVAPVFEKE